MTSVTSSAAGQPRTLAPPTPVHNTLSHAPQKAAAVTVVTPGQSSTEPPRDAVGAQNAQKDVIGEAARELDSQREATPPPRPPAAALPKNDVTSAQSAPTQASPAREASPDAASPDATKGTSPVAQVDVTVSPDTASFGSHAASPEGDSRKRAASWSPSPPPRSPRTISAYNAAAARHPVSPTFLAQVEDLVEELFVPASLLRPAAPKRQPRSRHVYTPYSAHAPRNPTSGPTHPYNVPMSSVVLRRTLMGKPLNPAPVTYPTTNAPGGRTRTAGDRAGVTHRVTNSNPCSADGTMRRCSLCSISKPMAAYGTGSKVRYCKACERLRWTCRKAGMRVEDIRSAMEAIEEWEEMEEPAFIERALELCGKKEARPGLIMSSREATAEVSESGAAQNGGPEGASTKVENGNNATPLDTAAAGAAAAASAAAHKDEKQQRQAPAQEEELRVCGLCEKPFPAMPTTPTTTFCKRCEVVKAMAKQGGFTVSELKRGVQAGIIKLAPELDASSITASLHCMLLGQVAPDAGQAERRAERAARVKPSPPTPAPDSTA